MPPTSPLTLNDYLRLGFGVVKSGALRLYLITETCFGLIEKI
jgi:hypothetical protein